MKETQLLFLQPDFINRDDFFIKSKVHKSPIVKVVKTPTVKSLKNCCCDYTNHCPVHGSRPTQPWERDSYINQP